MPELPEVETICRSLRDHVVGRTMAEVEIQLSRLIKWPTPEDFRSIMTGRTIEALERRGKYLLFQLSGDWVLVVHLRMTGRLYYRAADAAATGSPRVVFHFAGGDALEYYDTRTLGTLYLLRQNELSRIYGLSSLGPEPLTAELRLSIYRQDWPGAKEKSRACCWTRLLSADWATFMWMRVWPGRGCILSNGLMS